MFTHLTEFAFVRNKKQALGFYLAYLLVGIILGCIIGITISSFLLPAGDTLGDELGFGMRVGAFTGTVYSITIATILLVQKRLYTRFSYILLVLFSALLSTFGGSTIGLIIPAFMTTRPVASAVVGKKRGTSHARTRS